MVQKATFGPGNDEILNRILESDMLLQNGAPQVHGPFSITITLPDSGQPLQLDVIPHDEVHARVVRILLFASLQCCHLI